MSITAELDLFSLGKDAVATARSLFEGRAFLCSARRLQRDGTWKGPARASFAFADEGMGADLERCLAAGANALVCDLDGEVAGAAVERGLRVLVRVPFAAGEPADERARKLSRVAELLARVPGIDGILPQPSGDAQGLDTLAFFAACRQACPSGHLVVDVEAFGHKLGQLCLCFGADEIMGAIVGQRALRLGEHAASSEMTRDEAALLLRAAGFAPYERLPDGEVRAL